MRVFCLERDNVTQLCDPDSDGDVYTSSFELYPFHEGATYSLFMGVYNGNGPYTGQFCAVRCLLDVEAGPAHWQGTLTRSREAQRLAHEFNKELAYPAVFFNVPVLTRMETVSDFNSFFRCFKPHDKRLKHGEYVTLEPYLEGNFRQFDEPAGHPVKAWVPCPNRYPGEPDIIEQVSAGASTATHSSIYAGKRQSGQCTSSIAQAFSHFTWHATGRYIVTGLQGILSGLTYTLTNPVIHSLAADFGMSDGSAQAIVEFFRTHRCNNICRGWSKYVPDRNAHPQVNFYHHQAPYSHLHWQRHHPHQQIGQNGQPLVSDQKYKNLYTKNVFDSIDCCPSPSAPTCEENPLNSYV